jgi:predicted dienelactone hydrolase
MANSGDMIEKHLHAKTFLTKPSGGYHIGTTELFLTDTSRSVKIFFSKKPRKIYVKIWYPADHNDHKVYSKYLASFSRKIVLKIYKAKGINEQIADAMKHADTHSYPDLPVSSKENKYPVLIFSPGYYFGIADMYTCFMENLASHGYIVVSVTHPYEQPYVLWKDGEEIYLRKKKAQLAYLELLISRKLQFRKRNSWENIVIIAKNVLKRLKQFNKSLGIWVDDTEFVINYLEKTKKENGSRDLFKKMDMDKMGAFGMSFGGAVSGQVCLVDKRIKAGINMDCFQFGDVIRDPIKVPFMLIESNYRPDWNLGNRVVYADIKSDFYLLSLPNARHFVFTDVAVVPFLSAKAREEFNGNVDGAETIHTVNNYMLNFFDFYLKGKSSELLKKSTDDLSIRYEVWEKNMRPVHSLDKEITLS